MVAPAGSDSNTNISRREAIADEFAQKIANTPAPPVPQPVPTPTPELPEPKAEIGQIYYGEAAPYKSSEGAAPINGDQYPPNCLSDDGLHLRNLKWCKSRKNIYRNDNGNESYFTELRQKLVAETKKIEVWFGVTSEPNREVYENQKNSSDPEVPDRVFNDTNKAMSLFKLKAEYYVNNNILTDADPWTVSGVRDKGFSTYQNSAVLQLESMDRFATSIQKRAGIPTDTILDTHGGAEQFFFMNKLGG